MKLKKLIVKHFRGIGDQPVSVEIDDILVLIGRNNAGKSTILASYLAFSSLDWKMTVDDFHQRDTSKPVEITGVFGDLTDEDRQHQAVANSITEDTWSVRRVFSEPGQKGEKYTFKDANWEKGGSGGFDSLFANACPEPIYIGALEDPSKRAEVVQKLVSDLFSEYFAEKPEYEQLKIAVDTFQHSIEQDTGALKSIEDSLNGFLVAVFGTVRARIDPNTDDILARLNDFLSKNTGVYVTDNTKTPLDHQGHGVQRSFVISLLEGLHDKLRKKGAAKSAEFLRAKVLVIEEPELYLHPQALRIARDALYGLAESGRYQVMCSTHSPVFIDLSKDHTTLNKVTRDDSGLVSVSSVSSVLFDKDERSRLKMLLRFDPYVNEFFFAERVVLVEGDTEVTALAECASKLSRVTDKLKTDTHVVNCHGKMNIPLYQKVLHHFGTAYFVIHDTDEPKTGKGTANPAWTVNYSIGALVQESRANGLTCYRYCFTPNFESMLFSEQYVQDKPYQAMVRLSGLDANSLPEPLGQYAQVIYGLLDPETPDIFDDDYFAAQEVMAQSQPEPDVSNN